MIFRIAALLLTLAMGNGENGFSVDSKAGRKLLRKALERPENARILENAEMDGDCQNILEFLQENALTVNQFVTLYESGQIVNYNNGNNFAGMSYDEINACEAQIEFSVMGNMFIKYVGCASFVQDEADYANYWCRGNQQAQQGNQQQDAQGQEQEGEGNQYQWNQNANGNYDQAQAQVQCERNANEQYWMEKYGYQNAQNGNWNQNQYNAQNQWQADWWEYQVKAMNDGLEPTNLVHFTLCSDAYCGSCNGDYVMEMVDFLELYTEYKMEHAEYWCEKIRENCQCGYGTDWVTCYNTCFETKGLTYGDCKSYMDQNAQNDNMFDIQQYLDCAGVQFYNPEYIFSNNAGSYSYQHFYYIGPTCVDGNVVLGGFHDLQCTYPVDTADMQNLVGSYSIPYLDGSGHSLLKPDICISCLDPEDEADAYEQGQDYNWQENQNWEDQPEPSEICAMVTGADGEGKSMVCDRFENGDCNYILYTLPIYEQNGAAGNEGFFGGNSAVAQLTKQITRSKRISYALIGVVAALVFALAYFVGTLNRRIEPKNRKALLEYRREGGELS